MNELKAALRDLDQRYSYFKQQQFTFITALDHTRENAHDKTQPVSTLAQVQNYLDHHCNNATDKRIMIMFVDLCKDLSDFCTQLQDINPKSCSPDDVLEKCKVLLSCNNDMRNLRVKYPHDEVNHLSCEEAKHHYGGVISILPFALDYLKDGIGIIELAQYEAAKNNRYAECHKRDQPKGHKESSAQTGQLPSENCEIAAMKLKASIKKKNRLLMTKAPWVPPGKTNGL
ncbi:sperm acrosome-associated protein 9 isoform X1 [Leucoraja erinacea]|uniref:sperm acrosome-associated protein 9 isoform X1 n=1 Tax=Leucoraja erinaceus TaxID=7782 RepID=UPI0024552D16|nr:sperm acrosome-associated protein 9 isoform X1 [Leucoraja erinacea]XP_055515983.1 sperm acrosome-associated protein 9 isoform X1 [Leucoraja erinacea]